MNKPRYTEEAGHEVGRAHDLYQTLFAPLVKTDLLAPGRYRRLVLVGDGPLLDLPLAALVMNDDNLGKDKKVGEPRLLDRYAVSTAISFSVLTWLAQSNGKADQPLFCVADTANGTARERFPNAHAQKMCLFCQSRLRRAQPLRPAWPVSSCAPGIRSCWRRAKKAAKS